MKRREISPPPPRTPRHTPARKALRPASADPHSRVVDTNTQDELLARHLARASLLGTKRACPAMMKQYQADCAPDGEKEKLYRSAGNILKLVFGSATQAQKVAKHYQETQASQSFRLATLRNNPDLIKYIRQRLGDLEKTNPGDHKTVLRELHDHAEAIHKCYVGRRDYRHLCEKERRDQGHDAAYYRFKMAHLVHEVANKPGIIVAGKG
jgi:hypothetical protein